MNMILSAIASRRRGVEPIPLGLDVEACTFKVLEKAWKEAKEPQHREHVMPYFYEGVELITVKAEPLQTGISPRGFQHRPAPSHHRLRRLPLDGGYS